MIRKSKNGVSTSKGHFFGTSFVRLTLLSHYDISNKHTNAMPMEIHDRTGNDEDDNED